MKIDPFPGELTTQLVEDPSKTNNTNLDEFIDGING